MGTTVEMRGIVVAGVRSCTAARCGRTGDCCNRCQAAMGIVDPEQPDQAIVIEQMMCWGDDSDTCCPYGDSGQVVVTGTLRERQRYGGYDMNGKLGTDQLLTLDHVSVCTLGPQ